ncbi:hypothetical protein OEZ85_003743 [Tetradesmus obliquus]|uniref:Uncharacterized protein n=2 Tax=Tetradesmus obliquus TaxID=3088 RepID=A0A383V763_TETOB|nr:hypothetical protein OEZ85_003743 [Tetradesmus obliquus]|eukprot:jgi/Sobl393_1/14321/SZX60186.1
MLRTMVTQLLEHERIQTTLPKAKELRKVADRVVTYAKKGNKTGAVLAGAVVRTERELHKLMTVMAERYKQRQGGYTRVVQLGRRQHDAAPMAYIEYVDRPGELRPAQPPQESHMQRAAQAALRQRQRQLLQEYKQQQASRPAASSSSGQ